MLKYIKQKSAWFSKIAEKALAVVDKEKHDELESLEAAIDVGYKRAAWRALALNFRLERGPTVNGVLVAEEIAFNSDMLKEVNLISKQL